MELSEPEIQRYSRQILLGEVGGKGQMKLRQAKVLLIGAEGLGSPAGLYLAAAGVGTIGLVDGDVVDLSNLQRQILHSTATVGTPKVESGKKTLMAINPEITVITYHQLVDTDNILPLLKDYDFVLDGSDNFSTRAIIKSGIDGTTVVDFNPDLDGSDQAATITSSATGEIWTVNKSGGLPAQIVARPSLLFDGTADYLKANAFTLSQPLTQYIIAKQISWTLGDFLTDGNTASSVVVYQQTGSPQLLLLATSDAAGNGGLAVGTTGVISAVFNGASSSLQINLGTPTTGSPGANNAGGLTLGARANGANFGNFQVYEVLVFSTAHDATQRARVIQYAMGRHGIS